MASYDDHSPASGKAHWSDRYQQHFHDRNGAFEQARHVFLDGSRTGIEEAPRVLEIGFGLGLNFRVALADCAKRSVHLDYLAYEHDPQPRQVLEASSIDMPVPYRDGQFDWQADWQRVSSTWTASSAEIELELEHATLQVRNEDASIAALPDAWATAIYLDGFSPVVNPELWSEPFIARLAAALAPGGWIATYCSAGHVRRAMKKAGLLVERRAGWGTKWECLAAQKPVSAQ